MSYTVSEKVHKVANCIVEDLKKARFEGRIYPGKEVRSKTMAEGYTKIFGETIAESNIREAINFVRSEKNAPIGSNDHGYFYAVGKAELDHTIAHMKHRLERQYAALKGLQHAFDNVKQLEMMNEESPSVPTSEK